MEKKYIPRIGKVYINSRKVSISVLSQGRKIKSGLVPSLINDMMFDLMMFSDIRLEILKG